MTSFKDVLKEALVVGGFDCGHHLVFSKWIPSGENMGQVEINTLEEFRHHYNGGTYFLDLENVTIYGADELPFFVSYLCLTLTLSDGKWTGDVYTEKEELPHGYEKDMSKLEERRRRVTEKLLSVVRLLSALATAT